MVPNAWWDEDRIAACSKRSDELPHNACLQRRGANPQKLVAASNMKEAEGTRLLEKYVIAPSSARFVPAAIVNSVRTSFVP